MIYDSAEALSLTVGLAGTGTANLAPEFNRSYERRGNQVGSEQCSPVAARGLCFVPLRTTPAKLRPTNSLVYVLAGTQRVDGAELVINGRVSDRWQVLSSYTFMHSEVVHSQYYPASVGYRSANVPDNLFNIWTTYEPMHRLTIGGGWQLCRQPLGQLELCHWIQQQGWSSRCRGTWCSRR